MTSKGNYFSDQFSVASISRKRCSISSQLEVPASKKICLTDTMDNRLANFSISSNGVSKDTQRKKPAAGKKVLTIRLVPGELM